MSYNQISLKAARVNAGKTLEEVASHLNVSSKTIWNWESNESCYPDARQINALCALYSMPYDGIDFLKKSSV